MFNIESHDKKMFNKTIIEGLSSMTDTLRWLYCSIVLKPYHNYCKQYHVIPQVWEIWMWAAYVYWGHKGG